jgi:L-ascorbate metabolism protein UlaG (beta-lactamase superfamily)
LQEQALQILLSEVGDALQIMSDHTHAVQAHVHATTPPSDAQVASTHFLRDSTIYTRRDEMKITLTWLGHSAFRLNVGDDTILIDPYLTDNALASASAEELDADYILVTHGHYDHVGDAVSIAKRTGALIISNLEICNWMQAQGVDRVHPQQIGGGYTYPFGYLKLTIAHHASSLPDGSYGGCPAGLLLATEEKILYFAGDTGLFYDMRLIGEEGVDLAVLPIGDNYTMGPDDALRAVQLIEPKTVIPAHYDTFDVIRQDPHAWAERVNTETSTQAIVLEPGEDYEV